MQALDGINGKYPLINITLFSRIFWASSSPPQEGGSLMPVSYQGEVLLIPKIVVFYPPPFIPPPAGNTERPGILLKKILCSSIKFFT